MATFAFRCTYRLGWPHKAGWTKIHSIWLLRERAASPRLHRFVANHPTFETFLPICFVFVNISRCKRLQMQQMTTWMPNSRPRNENNISGEARDDSLCTIYALFVPGQLEIIRTFTCDIYVRAILTYGKWIAQLSHDKRKRHFQILRTAGKSSLRWKPANAMKYTHAVSIHLHISLFCNLSHSRTHYLLGNL